MKKLFLAILLSLCMAGTSGAVTLNFDDINLGGSSCAHLNAYDVLLFDGTHVIDGTLGFELPMVSENNYIEINWHGAIFADDFENGFTLNDMYITTFQDGYAPVAMEIEGRDIHGDWHYASVGAIAAQQFIELDWIDIEYLGFSAETQYAWASIDNLRINEPTGGSEPVPEPATIVLLGAGLAGLGFVQRKRMAKKETK